MSDAADLPARHPPLRDDVETPSAPVRAIRRAAALGSDAIVLTIAAPFIAVWYVYRTARRWTIGR